MATPPETPEIPQAPEPAETPETPEAPEPAVSAEPAEPPQTPETTNNATPGTLRAQLAVVTLAAASGAVETIAFLGLGHVFAGVITGNLALLGMALGNAGGKTTEADAAALAVLGYAVGLAVVAPLTRRSTSIGGRWAPRVLACLIGETVLLAVGAGLWAAANGAPGPAAQHVLQFGASFAMGAQSAAMLATGKPVGATTYMTGSLSTFVVNGLGTSSERANPWVPLRLAAVIAGAAAAAAVRSASPSWAAAMPAFLVAAGTLIGSELF
jgi:uncharacterized membrane protein YoaK (UPF0700 family)